MSCSSSNPFGLTLGGTATHPEPEPAIAGTGPAGTGDAGTRVAQPTPVSAGPADPVPGTVAVLDAPLPGRQMSAVERYLALIAQYGKRFAGKAGSAGTPAAIARHLWGAQPMSMAQHRAHVKAAAWLGDYAGAGWAKWAKRAWVAYHVTVARSLKATGNSISALGDKARYMATVLACVVIAVILAAIFGI